MDTAEIEVFLVLAEELHFGRTAERLRLPQPRVSRLVASLERRAGGAHMAPLTRLAEAFEARHPDSRAVLDVVSNFDPYSALRRGELDVLVNWLAVDEPDLTAGPVLEHRDRVLAVARADPLADRASVTLEDLADREVAQMTPSFPPALTDAIFPPRAPSGREIRRGPAVRSIHELVSLVVRGQIVHPTASGIPMFTRDDIALIPIIGLPPLPLGLIWVTAHENARIGALAEIARSIG